MREETPRKRSPRGSASEVNSSSGFPVFAEQSYRYPPPWNVLQNPDGMTGPRKSWKKRRLIATPTRVFVHDLQAGGRHDDQKARTPSPQGLVASELILQRDTFRRPSTTATPNRKLHRIATWPPRADELPLFRHTTTCHHLSQTPTRALLLCFRNSRTTMLTGPAFTFTT